MEIKGALVPIVLQYRAKYFGVQRLPELIFLFDDGSTTILNSLILIFQKQKIFLY